MSLSDGLGSSLYSQKPDPMAAPKPDSKQDDGINWIDGADLWRAPIRGVARFGESMLNLGKDGLNLVRGLWGKATGDELTEEEKFKDFDFDPFFDTRWGKSSIVGGFLSGAVQFGAGMLTATQALSGIQWIAKGGVMSSLAKGAVADFISFDEHEERLSNWLESSVPVLSNPVTEFLAASDEDNWAVGRLKNSIEGAGLGFAMDGLVKLFKSYKGFKQLNELLTQKQIDLSLFNSKLKEVKEAKQEALSDLIDSIARKDGDIGRSSFADLGIDPTASITLTKSSKLEAAKKAADVLESHSQADLDKWMSDVASRLEAGESMNTIVRESDIIHGMNYNSIASPEDLAVFQATLESVIKRGKTPNALVIARSLDDISGTGFGLFTEEIGKVAPENLPNNIFARSILASFVGSKLTSAWREALLYVDKGVKAPEELKEAIRNLSDLFSNGTKKLVELKQHVGTALNASKLNAKEHTETLNDAFSTLMNSSSRRDGRKLAKAIERSVSSSAKRETSLLGMNSSQQKGFMDALIKLPVEEQAKWLRRGIACENPQQLTKFIDGGTPILTKVLKANNQWWISAVLSGSKTQVVNVLSNSINTVLKPLELAIGSAMGGDASGLRRAYSQYKGMASSLLGLTKFEAAARAGLEESSAGSGSIWNAAGKSIKEGTPQLDGNPKFEGMTDALSAEAFDTDPKSVMGKFLNALGFISNIPKRFLVGMDEITKQINYRGKLEADTIESLLQQGLAKNSNEFAEAFSRKMAEGIDPATGRGTNESAIRYAEEVTFTQNPTGPIESEVYNALKTVSNTPLFKPIVPFVRTPLNIVNHVWDRTPVLRRLRDEVRADLRSGDPARVARRRGELAMGTLMWSTAAILANEGLITGSGPDNNDARALWRQAGNQPYSVKIGDKYVSFSRLDPYGMVLGLAADFAQMSGHLSEQQSGSLASMMLTALSRNLASKTYLKGLADFLDAVFEGGPVAQRWVNSLASGYIPRSISSFKDDPYLREVRTVVDAWKNQIPGLSSTLPPRRNIFGEPITLPHGLGWDFASPFAMTQKVDDKVKNELARLGHGFSMPSKIYGKFDLTQARTVEGREAYDRLLELTGQVKIEGKTLDKALAYLMKQRAYKDSPEEATNEFGDSGIRVKSIQRLMSMYKAQAMKQLQRECPEFAQYRAQRRAEQLGKITARRRSSGLMALLN